MMGDVLFWLSGLGFTLGVGSICSEFLIKYLVSELSEVERVALGFDIERLRRLSRGFLIRFCWMGLIVSVFWGLILWMLCHE